MVWEADYTWGRETRKQKERTAASERSKETERASSNMLDEDKILIINIHFMLIGNIYIESLCEFTYVLTIVQGTNQFHAALVDRLSKDDVRTMFKRHAEKGANVMRVFAHSDGYGFPDEMPVEVPIQPQLGKYNEKALQRLDLVLAEAGKNGIKLILPFTNFEPFLGGIQWYAEQVHGPGSDKELFYTDETIKEAYKKYVKKLILRKNTITGVLYKNDPTVMAWELMNEPHTRDAYEKDRGMQPGNMVLKWIEEMASYVKSLDPNHVLLTGEEG